MLKQSFTILSLVFGGMLLIASVLTVAAAPDNYFPLAVGNHWVYESSEGTKEDPALESWDVIRREGTTFVVRVQQPFVTEGGMEEMFEPVLQGVQRHIPNGKTSEAQLILKLPPIAGARWQNADGSYTITSMGETVTVPAGTFANCVAVTQWREKTNITIVSTYAPGVGLIQRAESFPIIGGFGSGGDFDSRAKGHAVLKLRDWRLQGQPSEAKTKR